MRLGSIFHQLTYRVDYEKAMNYLSRCELKDAAHFSTDEAPEALRVLYRKLHEPCSEQRSKWIDDFAANTWSQPDGTAEVLMAQKHLNTFRYLNQYLRSANEKLKQNGLFVCGFDTAQKRKMEIYSHHGRLVADFVYAFDFLWHRVCPKLWLTKKFYFLCTSKVRKVYPRSEVLGRLYYCGFEVCAESYIHNRYYVLAQKKRLPYEDRPTYGPIVKLTRVGKNEKLFSVYKIRTMHAYSEYLQTYVYDNNSLQKGGKFQNDYRISDWGMLLRKYWIDELPMIFNILKGDLKLVGVRPLSLQYFHLYTPEMQKKHVMVKPGLLPPYYSDMPETIEEIQESEERYIDLYLKHPFKTDWIYFWKIMYNILIAKKRSK
jgi:Sugar transferases involved in lipopolysaccharide synthesis